MPQLRGHFSLPSHRRRALSVSHEQRQHRARQRHQAPLHTIRNDQAYGPQTVGRKRHATMTAGTGNRPASNAACRSMPAVRRSQQS